MRIYLFVVMLYTIVCSCSKDAQDIPYPQSFPLVFTDPVTNITSDGAEFVGHVTHLGKETIISHGFVLSTKSNPTIESIRLVIEDDLKIGQFSKQINTYIVNGATYYVRAYVQTNRIIAYGENVTFVSKGSQSFSIKDFSPKEGFDGTEVTIEVENLIPDTSTQVAFGGLACEILNMTENSIKVKIPPSTLVGDHQFMLTSNKVAYTKNEYFTVLSPRITSIFPAVSYVGDTIIIDGEYFDKATLNLEFQVNESYTKWNYVKVLSPTKIKAVVPDFGMLMPPPLYLASTNSNVTKRVQYTGLSSPRSSWKSLGTINRLLAQQTSVAFAKGEHYVNGLGVMSSYDPAVDKWTSRPPINGGAPLFVSGRYNCIMYEWGGNLYSGLGEIERGFATGYNVYKEIYKYNPSTGQWIYLMNAPFSERSSANCFVINNQVYMGFGVNNNLSARYNDFWKLNPINNTWSQITTPITNNTKDGLTSFVVNGKAYFLESGNPKVWEFDPANSTWTRKGDAPMWTNGGDVAAVFGDRAFIVLNRRLYEYTPSTDRWRVRQSAPGFSHHAPMFSDNGKIYFGYTQFDQGHFYEFTIPN